MRGKGPPKGTDIDKLTRDFPLAAGITERLLGKENMHRHSNSLKERIQDWKDLYYKLTPDASLDELVTLWRACPYATLTEAVALRIQILRLRRACESDGAIATPPSPPPVNHPAKGV